MASSSSPRKPPREVGAGVFSTDSVTAVAAASIPRDRVRIAIPTHPQGVMKLIERLRCVIELDDIMKRQLAAASGISEEEPEEESRNAARAHDCLPLHDAAHMLLVRQMKLLEEEEVERSHSVVVGGGGSSSSAGGIDGDGESPGEES